MSEAENAPYDPFANLDLDSLRQESSMTDGASYRTADIESVRRTAEDSEFWSRPVAPRKRIVMSKTFSLFEEEIAIINSALISYRKLSGELSPTTSNPDAVRAAIYLLAEK